MNYFETLEKIHSFQTFGSRLGLERMQVLLRLLGNPQDGMKVIHVAGTNGKGSVCRYLTAALRENGYRIGLYTSPYLERFTERIEFDGAEIAEKELVECAATVFEKIEEMLVQGHESPTEFELVTALAFLYFSKKPMDFLILEVGLGGRGDSTNVIEKPVASVITSISYDHTDVLGETLTEIAAEKAGIIKPHCPVIASVKAPEALAVIRQTASAQCCAFFDATAANVTRIQSNLDGYSFSMPFAGEDCRINLGMPGLHQVENAVLALSVLEVLAKQGIINSKSSLVIKGIGKAKHNGRLEILRKDPYLIIDGAHNEGGAAALAGMIREYFAGKRVLLILGVLGDKKIDRILEQLACVEADFAATEPDNPRKLSADALCEKIRETGRSCVSLGNWERACAYAVKKRDLYDAVFFSGSLYLIGRVRGRFYHDESK